MSEKESPADVGLIRKQTEKPRLPAKRTAGGKLAQRKVSLPPATRSALDLYVAEINRVPLLSREEEEELARRFKDEDDPEAARRLVEANLRFVVKMAHSYKHYNVKMVDLIQEGNIGLMRAVQKFNPDRGYRLISYAVWWIKAYMQNYIIRSWSMVRVGTSQAQRQLFFRRQTDKEEDGSDLVEEVMAGDQSQRAADGEVILVTASARRKRAKDEVFRASRDFSLDADVGDDGKQTFVDLLPSPGLMHDEALGREEILQQVSDRLGGIMEDLNDKEQYILQHRLLADESETLQDIGDRFKVSRERIRQIETALKKKLAAQLGDIEGVKETW